MRYLIIWSAQTFDYFVESRRCGHKARESIRFVVWSTLCHFFENFFSTVVSNTSRAATSENVNIEGIILYIIDIVELINYPSKCRIIRFSYESRYFALSSNVTLLGDSLQFRVEFSKNPQHEISHPKTFLQNLHIFVQLKVVPRAIVTPTLYISLCMESELNWDTTFPWNDFLGFLFFQLCWRFFLS